MRLCDVCKSDQSVASKTVLVQSEVGGDAQRYAGDLCPTCSQAVKQAGDLRTLVAALAAAFKQ